MKITLKIPSNLSDIKLYQFQKYHAIANDENNKDTFFLKQKAVEIFCNCPLDLVAKIPFKDVDEIYNTVIKILDTQVEFKRTFNVGHVELGFHPNFENMESGEYMDLSSYISDIENWHKAMAVLYRPITMKKKDSYLIEEYTGSDKWSNEMRKLPMDRVNGGIFFLTSLYKLLSKDTIAYLMEEAQKYPELKKDLEKNGNGLRMLMNLQEEMF